MTALKQEVIAPFTHNLECPICRVPLDITLQGVVNYVSGSVGGTDGLGRATSVSIRISARPDKLVIERHECVIEAPTD